MTRVNIDDGLRRLIRQLPIALAYLDNDGRLIELSDRFVELFGYARADVPSIEAWWPLAYPDPVYRQQVMAIWDAAVREAVASGSDIRPNEYRVTCRDGEVRIVEIFGVKLTEGLLGVFVDLTERKRFEQRQDRLNRELRAISSCNQALLRAEDEQSLLDEVCRIICDEAGYRVACVAYAEHDPEQSVRLVARTGMDDDYFAGVRLTWADRDFGRGPVGTTIRTGEVVVVQDIASDPRMAFWRDRAAVRGYRSVVAVPLRDEHQSSFGALLIYSGEANAITTEEVRLLEALAADLAFGITTLRIRAERHEAAARLAASEELFRALVENSPDAIARYDLELRRVYLNPAIRTLFQIPPADALGTTPALRSPLADPERYMACLRRVVDTAQEHADEFAYRRADGVMGWAAMRFTPEFGLDGKVASVLAISHDITERKRAEEERQGHLHFLESMNRVNRAIQGATDIEQMMGDVLDEVLAIFDCDRAYLQYPCDPAAPEWWIPTERCQPACPSALAPGERRPMDAHISATLAALLASGGAVRLGPGTNRPIPVQTTKDLGVRSVMAMALRPMADRPWQFGLHQCSHARIWTAQEERLFEEIGRRLTDGLNSLLVTRNLRESEERFRLVFEHSPLPIWEEDFSAVKIRLDQLQAGEERDVEAYLVAHPEVVRECAQLVRIVDVNRAVLGLHGAESKEVLFQGLAQTFIPESYEAFRRELVAMSRGETELLFDSAVQTLAGERREVTVYFSVCPGYERSLGKVLVSLIDITERKRAEDRLSLAASVFATSQEGILISDPDNRIIDVNPAFTRLTGYSRDEALGRNPAFLSARRQGREFYRQMWQAIEARGEWQGELWNRRKNGEVYAELLSIIAVKNRHGRLQHYVGAFSDISVFKEHEADLDRIAHYDVLTSVPNRRLLSDRLEQAIAHARRHGKNLAVCYLDLDGFKPINDQFGHEGGDRLLVEIARRLQAMSRGDDTVARLGGDEFVLLWNDVGAEAECFQALDRILREVSAPMLLDGVPVSVSASIGVTLFPDDNVDADSLLRHADHAMYSAKQMGKNRYQLFDARLERQISSRNEVIAKAGRALDAGEFELHYQPKVDCVAHRLIGVEALIRWNDPVLGMIGPNQFLSLIENDNLAFRMGRWVMERAVGQARLWHEAGFAVPISINIFPRHLKHPDFVGDLRAAIAAQWPQMPADTLLMEIVETSELEELTPIEAVIRQCLEMGVGFSLDDFGTGYSSLIYLRRLSVKELKIDQSFVRDMLDDPDDHAIVVGVIGLGKAFGLRVVAEGVESDAQARRLIELGCPNAQGYELGRPMPAGELPTWYAEFRQRRTLVRRARRSS